MTNPSNDKSSSSVETSVGAQERLRALIVEAFEAGSNNAIAREQDCGDYKIPTYDEEIARLTRELESLLMSAPLRGKDAEIDRGVLSTAAPVEQSRETILSWLHKMQSEIRAEGHYGWGNTLDDVIAYVKGASPRLPAGAPLTEK
jgi:hypothetical protein